MPTYDWYCGTCNESWEVMTLISRRDDPSECPTCHKVGARGSCYVTQVHGSAGDWNRVEFNPGLGQWTKSRKHTAQIAKAKGLVEVGNEKPETIHKHFDTQRAAAREQSWKEADRVKLYDD